MRMACKGEMDSTEVLSTLQIRCGVSNGLVNFCTVFSEHGVMRSGVYFLDPSPEVVCVCV